MKMFATKTTQVQELEAVVCDCCKVLYYSEFYAPDNYNPNHFGELDEFLHVDFTGGYFSIFGDMSKVQGDFCQTCVKKLLGKFLTVKDDDGNS